MKNIKFVLTALVVALSFVFITVVNADSLKDPVTVTFDTHGGSSVPSQTIERGTSPQKPADPTRGDDIFLGWYIDTEYDVLFNFKFHTIEDDTVTIHALFAPKDKVISNLDASLTLPKAGTKFIAKTDDQSPRVKVISNTANVSAEAGIVVTKNNQLDLFSGIVENGKVYNFLIYCEPNSGYYLNYPNLSITLNGKKITSDIEFNASYAVFLYKSKLGDKVTNPITVKVIKRTVDYNKLVNKKQTVKAIKLKKAKGTVTYKKVKGKKYFTVNKKTGKVTVKKGTPRGTYKIKVKVTAKGTPIYSAKTKTVTAKIIIR